MEVGDTIKVFGYEWEVLDTEYETLEGIGTLILMKDFLDKMVFDENSDNFYPNSDVAAYLKKVSREYKEQGADFATVTLDMIADDGTGWDKGVYSTKGLFLLTENMYRKYRRYISNKDDCWWLSTAYSFTFNYLDDAQIVSTDGSLYYNYVFHDDIGVCPACILFSFPTETDERDEIKDIKRQMEKLAQRLAKLEA